LELRTRCQNWNWQASDTIAVVTFLPARSSSTIAVGRNPYGVALSPDEQSLMWVILQMTCRPRALSFFRVITTIFGFIEPAQAIAFARDGLNGCGVLNSGLSVSIVNLTTKRIVSTIRFRSNVETAGICAAEGEIQ